MKAWNSASAVGILQGSSSKRNNSWKSPKNYHATYCINICESCILFKACACIKKKIHYGISKEMNNFLFVNLSYHTCTAYGHIILFRTDLFFISKSLKRRTNMSKHVHIYLVKVNMNTYMYFSFKHKPYVSFSFYRHINTTHFLYLKSQQRLMVVLIKCPL